jgi:hypothetical protein
VVTVTNAQEIDNGGQRLQQDFRAWLLRVYGELTATGEIQETTPARTRAEKITYMRDLFNRSQGRIRHAQIRNRATGQTIRPTPAQMQQWLGMWQREPFDPARLSP